MSRAPLYRRLPWISIAIALAVVLSAAFAVAPVREVATHEDVNEVALDRPLAYVALAPLSNVLDMITLLSRAQHIAFVAGIVVIFAAWRGYRAWHGRRSWRDHVVPALALFVGLLAVYAAVALLPRPMAALVTADANIVRIDFHSHTSASHDVRSSWTAERNREWHRAGGYDVAFVTDHGEVSQAERALVSNPTPAGGGVTLLQAIEVTWSGEHVAIIGAERSYKGLLTQSHRDVDPQALQLASLIPEREPVVIWHHPRVLSRLAAASGPRTAGVRAIEISNGAPDSMDEVRRGRERIIALARRNNLMMTTGSDSHGWGRTAPNWTMLMIYNWRALSADALSAQIENVIRKGAFAGSRVVERRAATGTDPFTLGLTILAAPLRMLTTLSIDERVAWLIWIALITLAPRFVRGLNFRVDRSPRA